MITPASSAGDAITRPTEPRAVTVKQALRAPSAELFLIDDEENITQALLNSVTIDWVGVSTTTTLEATVRDMLAERGIAIYPVENTVAAKLFGTERRSRVFAVARWVNQPTLDDILNTSGDVVVLDGVRLAGNMGAIIRNACAFGAGGVILVRSELPSIVDRRLVRASRGTVFAVPVVLASADDVVSALVGNDRTVVALDGAASEPISGLGAVDGRVAVIMGSEKHGVSPEFVTAADRSFRIDIDPRIESLNVSVATAIALYERAQRRN